MNRRTFIKSLGAASLLAYQKHLYATSSDVIRRLRFVVEFSNPTSNRLINQRFWWLLPYEDESQHLQNVRVSRPFRQHATSSGERYLELWFDEFPAFGQSMVSISVDVAVSDTTPQLALQNTAEWLKAERYIEVGDNAIQAVAAELRRSHPTDTTRAVYDWVRTRLSYAGYVAEELGALYALTHRSGDCTEYADLVVALCRANGIPARFVGGYVVQGDGLVRSSDYHNWAEAYFDGAWQIVDAQREAWQGKTSQYLKYSIGERNSGGPIGPGSRHRMQGELIALF